VQQPRKVYLYGILLLGALIGGYVATFDHNFAIALCISASITGLLYSFFRLTEKQQRKKFRNAWLEIIDKMTDAFRISFRNKTVRIIYTVAILFGIGTGGIFAFWQPAFAELNNWNESELGFYFMLISLAVIIGAKISGYFKPSMGKYSIALFTLWLFLALAGFVHLPILAPIFILVWEVALGFVQPLESTLLNQNTKSETRATNISIKNMAYRLGFAIIGFAIYLVGDFKINEVWIVTSFAFFIAAIIVVFTKVKN